MSNKTIILSMVAIIISGFFAVFYTLNGREEVSKMEMIMPTNEAEVITQIIKELTVQVKIAEVVQEKGMALRPIREYAEARKMNAYLQAEKLRNLSVGNEILLNDDDWNLSENGDVTIFYIEKEIKSHQTIFDLIRVFETMSHTSNVAKELSSLKMETESILSELEVLSKLLPQE